MSLERDFEEFDGGPNISSRDKLHVTIRPLGEIYLNSTTHQMMGRPQAVKLFYSRERDTIAIVRAEPRQAKSFPLKKDATGYRINSAPFCGHYRISVKDTQRFTTADIDASGYLLLDLRKTVTMTPRKHKRNR